MAGIPIGQVEQFKPSTDDWEQYHENLAQYFVANGIDAEEKGSTEVDGPNAENIQRSKLKHSFQLVQVKGRHK